MTVTKETIIIIVIEISNPLKTSLVSPIGFRITLKSKQNFKIQFTQLRNTSVTSISEILFFRNNDFNKQDSLKLIINYFSHLVDSEIFKIA